MEADFHFTARRGRQVRRELENVPSRHSGQRDPLTFWSLFSVQKSYLTFWSLFSVQKS
jgi:hypothetical protein